MLGSSEDAGPWSFTPSRLEINIMLPTRVRKQYACNVWKIKTGEKHTISDKNPTLFSLFKRSGKMVKIFQNKAGAASLPQYMDQLWIWYSPLCRNTESNINNCIKGELPCNTVKLQFQPANQKEKKRLKILYPLLSTSFLLQDPLIFFFFLFIFFVFSNQPWALWWYSGVH